MTISTACSIFIAYQAVWKHKIRKYKVQIALFSLLFDVPFLVGFIAKVIVGRGLVASPSHYSWLLYMINLPAFLWKSCVFIKSFLIVSMKGIYRDESDKAFHKGHGLRERSIFIVLPALCTASFFFGGIYGFAVGETNWNFQYTLLGVNCVFMRFMLCLVSVSGSLVLSTLYKDVTNNPNTKREGDERLLRFVTRFRRLTGFFMFACGFMTAALAVLLFVPKLTKYLALCLTAVFFCATTFGNVIYIYTIEFDEAQKTRFKEKIFRRKVEKPIIKQTRTPAFQKETNISESFSNFLVENPSLAANKL